MTRLRARPAGPPAASVRPRKDSFGRGGSGYAERISDALRREDSAHLTRRRQAAGLALGACAALGTVGAYQVGILRSVPEPPLPGVDADAVDATASAYRVLGTPDAALGMASYAVTFGLVAAGAADRASTRPWLPLLAAGKVLLDVLSGGYLFAEQLSGHRKLCSWCTAASLTSVLMVPAVLPEAWDAARSLVRRRPSSRP